MTEERNDKAVVEEKPKPKKPPGYRAFEKLLKQVVNAPPLPIRHKTSTVDSDNA
jgi:hypothetical protein